jgi:hypothetical protein
MRLSLTPKFFSQDTLIRHDENHPFLILAHRALAEARIFAFVAADIGLPLRLAVFPLEAPSAGPCELIPPNAFNACSTAESSL